MAILPNELRRKNMKVIIEIKEDLAAKTIEAIKKNKAFSKKILKGSVEYTSKEVSINTLKKSGSKNFIFTLNGPRKEVFSWTGKMANY